MSIKTVVPVEYLWNSPQHSSCSPPLLVCYKKDEGLVCGRETCKFGQVRKEAAVARSLRVMGSAPHS